MIDTEKTILNVLYINDTTYTRELVYLFGFFEKSAASTRAGLSRLKRKGFIHSYLDKKQTANALTPKGRELCKILRQKFYHNRESNEWNGNWHLVTFDIPENQREARDLLRRQITLLGYGQLHNSLWIYPYDRTAEIQNFSKRLKITEKIKMFICKPAGFKTDRSFAFKIWDLKGIQKKYTEIYNMFSGKYDEYKENKTIDGKNLDNMHAYMVILMFNSYLQKIVEKDPELPDQLLPPDWIGLKVQKLYESFKDILSKDLILTKGMDSLLR